MSISILSKETCGDDSISQAEFSAFTGGGIYPNEWIKYREGKSRHLGWNGWAAILGAQWFFYRKLYTQGALAALVELILFSPMFLFGDFFRNLIGSVNAFFYLICASWLLLIRIGIGYWANAAYYKKAVAVIREADLLNLDNDAHLRVIKSEGGINVPAFLLAYVAYAVLARLG
ncbi:DUF2628 domain-containing protein [Herbaspirillum rhizosphaerae]|uniref:DUF2628 domain-containing protein n=1 Tax=Herbaspirillum rhizosphaerae TaxID=346179 RepID=A0ABW8Z8Y0_9BURK